MLTLVIKFVVSSSLRPVSRNAFNILTLQMAMLSHLEETSYQ